MRYHLNLIPEDVELKYAVSFAYGDSVQCKGQKKCEVLPGNAYPLYTSDEKGVLRMRCLRIRLVSRRQDRETEIVLWIYTLTIR